VWDTKSNGSPDLNTLKIVDVPIVDKQVCQAAYQGLFLTNNHVCAKSQNNDFCQSDSPLFCSRQIYGIASYGYGCGNTKYQIVYTKISAYVSWILTNIS
jgi:trypsin